MEASGENASKARVVAVIVAYNPEHDSFDRLLKEASRQTARVVVVDNGSRVDVGRWIASTREDNIELLAQGENKGIAAAQNVGIERARALGAEYVILFDHDSAPTPPMVAQLVEAVQRLESMGHKVAAVGPRYLDERQNNPPPFIRVEGLRLKRCSCEKEAIVAVDYLISSGSLIPLATLNAVGGMREDFFIDYVDIEWGLRAKAAGFQSFGVCDARMSHNLGENPLVLFGRRLPLHSPLRHYYLFRNAVRLYSQAGVPLNWKLADGYRLLLKYGVYTLFTPSRWQHFKFMTLGLWHGWRGRMGAFGKRT